MNKFLQDWLYNLGVSILIFIGVAIFMLIFMEIFYPEVISGLILMGQMSVMFINALKLWPLLILWIIVSALPRRRRR